jgi:hypothetical protein
MIEEVNIVVGLVHVQYIHAVELRQKDTSFEHKYSVGSLLASGGFGTVYCGVRKLDGIQVTLCCN